MENRVDKGMYPISWAGEAAENERQSLWDKVGANRSNLVELESAGSGWWIIMVPSKAFMKSKV